MKNFQLRGVDRPLSVGFLIERGGFGAPLLHQRLDVSCRRVRLDASRVGHGGQEAVRAAKLSRGDLGVKRVGRLPFTARQGAQSGLSTMPSSLGPGQQRIGGLEGFKRRGAHHAVNILHGLRFGLGQRRGFMRSHADVSRHGPAHAAQGFEDVADLIGGVC